MSPQEPPPPHRQPGPKPGPAGWITFSFLCLLLAAATGCSPLGATKTACVPGVTQPDIDSSTDEDNQYVTVEPEEVLEDELAALNQLGDWEDGSRLQEAGAPEVTYDFPVVVNKQVEFYLNLFQGRQRKYFKRWLGRSTRYLPLIRRELKEAGLPGDLAYLAMIESGFNPSAYSRAHAAGLWQFIKGTGRNYGLRIDSWVDERREPEKATRAAVAYLSNLYSEFNDWYLAVAAYNAGEGKIRRAIKRYRTRDFWQLARHRYLRLETKRYVPKLIAAIMIARNPEQYGFTDIDYQEPVRYELIKVPPRTDLAAVAVAANTTVKEIRRLNIELRRNQTPPRMDGYRLKIPHGTAQLVARNMARLHPVITTGYKTHVVRGRDTLNRICRLYGLNKTTLLKANNLHSARLRKGQRLRIPYRTTRYILLREGETLDARFARAGREGRMILHRIRRGDTLSRISKQYNVPVHIIMQWNNITDVRRIRAGEQLALYLDTGDDVSGGAPRAAAGAGDRALLVLNGSSKHRPAGTGRKSGVTWYRVRNGDSLWTIARRFRVSARDIRRWNNLQDNMIHPGRRLVIRKG
ncbi:MAG TPA: LysM peptidoglycan-binding domain-containing protein [Desulfobulbus sp.]|nr:LysM peptidoglycan-binding domain-containing protein [Desulfobulbus sp.]